MWLLFSLMCVCKVSMMMKVVIVKLMMMVVRISVCGKGLV